MGNPPTLHFGPQTQTNPTNAASVSSIPNGSAAGTSFGTLSTTLGGSPTFSIVYDGGHAVQAVGSSLEVLYAEPINIMYRRALQLSFQASGVVGGGIVNIPSLATVSIPATPTGGTTLAVTGIQGTLTATDLTLTAQNTGFEVATIVESGSATLTISSSVSSPTLREVNAGWPPETGTSNFVTQLTSTGVTPLQWSFLGQVLAIASGGYTSATGVIVLTMSQVVQSSFAGMADSLTGTGAYASLDGTWPVISVSGSIVPLQGPTGAGAATITGGKIAIGQSPLEVHCYTGVVAMVGRCVYNSTGLGGAEGVNWWAGSNQVGLVRVQDSTGAWGTSEIACSVTQRSTLAQLSSDLPSCGLNDWSNITVSGANLLTAQLMLNGTNYTMVVPSGANPPQISTYVGPDGNTRNTCTYPGGQISLASGAAYSGSGTGILASFNQSNIANTNGAVGSVVNVTSTLSFGGNITDSGGNGVSVDTQGGGYLEAHASNASGVALIGGAQHLTAGWNTMMSSSDGNTVIGEAGTFTGQNVLVNPTLGGTTPAGDFSNNPILPKTNSFTCSALTVDNTPYGQAWISGLDWFSTRGLLDYERDILYCYIARRWATGYTPAKCALSNAREPLLIINNWNQIAGTTVYRQGQFFQYYHDWDSSTGVGTVNGYDLGAYVNTDVAGVSDVWPERNGYVDNNGHFVSAVQEIYPHQRAWMVSNPGKFPPAGGVNNVNGRAFGMDTRMSFGPYQGFWEVKFKLPAGQALAGVPMWAYNQSATAFELDQVEQYGNSNPSRSVFTAHAANGVQQGINYPMNDSSINFVWVTTDWYSLNDGSGNDAIELYVNRRLVTTVYNPSSLWPTPLFPYMSFTTGDVGYPVPNTYTPFGYVNGAMTVAAWNVLANPDTQISPGSVFAVAQLPAVQVQPAISGPRGGLLTCSTPTYKWGIYLYLSPTDRKSVV